MNRYVITIIATLAATRLFAPGYEAIPYDPNLMSADAISFYQNNTDIRSPVRAINTDVGQGLDAQGGHGNAPGMMWLTANTTPFQGAWFVVDFTETNNITAIKFWNYNETGQAGRGAKDVDFYYWNGDGAEPPTAMGTVAPFFTHPSWTPLLSANFPATAGAANYKGEPVMEFAPIRFALSVPVVIFAASRLAILAFWMVASAIMAFTM